MDADTLRMRANRPFVIVHKFDEWRRFCEQNRSFSIRKGRFADQGGRVTGKSGLNPILNGPLVQGSRLSQGGMHMGINLSRFLVDAPRRRPSCRQAVLTTDFPVCRQGPTPHGPPQTCKMGACDAMTARMSLQRWDWKSFSNLPSGLLQLICTAVTRWSKLGTFWEGVSLDAYRRRKKRRFLYARSFVGDYTTKCASEGLF